MSPHSLPELAASPAARPRRRAAARSMAVLALVGSLLAPGSAAAYQDGDEGADAPVAVPPADPVFTAGAAVTLSIAEGHADGASVGTVAATDANGDVLAYSLSGADAASFTIDAATGEISVAPGVSLDFDTRSSHSVTAAVSDGNDADGNPEDTPTEDATIAVTIEVTEAPATARLVMAGPKRPATRPVTVRKACR